MNRKINNLEELLEEKKRLHTQIQIVQDELVASAQRTREEFRTLVDEKFSLARQLGSLFNGNGKQAGEPSALQTIGQAVGRSTWWGNLAVTLIPLVMNFVREQVGRWKHKREEKREAKASMPAQPKSKGRKLFKRKTPKPDAPQS